MLMGRKPAPIAARFSAHRHLGCCGTVDGSVDFRAEASRLSATSPRNPHVLGVSWRPQPARAAMRRPGRNSDGRDGRKGALYPSSCRTNATSRSQTASASAASGASTITRTSGSVPEGRRSTRPRPSSAAFSSSTASQTAVGAGEALAVGDLDVDQALGQLLHRRGVGERRAAQLAHGQERGGDPVAGGDDVGGDDVARLLAAELPLAAQHLVDHVAVADLGDRRPRSRPPSSPGGSRSWSSR